MRFLQLFVALRYTQANIQQLPSTYQQISSLDESESDSFRNPSTIHGYSAIGRARGYTPHEPWHPFPGARRGLIPKRNPMIAKEDTQVNKSHHTPAFIAIECHALRCRYVGCPFAFATVIHLQ